MDPIRILTGDDDAGMRLVMRRLVERAEGYELVPISELLPEGETTIDPNGTLRPAAPQTT